MGMRNFSNWNGNSFPVGMKSFPSRNRKHYPEGEGISSQYKGEKFPIRMGNVFYSQLKALHVSHPYQETFPIVPSPTG